MMATRTYRPAGAQLRIAQSRPSLRSGGGTSNARNDLFRVSRHNKEKEDSAKNTRFSRSVVAGRAAR